MPNEMKLCESDYPFMSVIRDNEPLTSGALVEKCAEALGWKKSTTYTVLKKMCDKGLLNNEKAMVTVAVPREKVDNYAAEDFVGRTFGGSLPGFLTAFMGGKKLTAQEADQLKNLIDQYQE